MGRYFFLGLPRSVVACSYACPGSLITALFPLWPVSLPVTSVGFLTGDNTYYLIVGAGSFGPAFLHISIINLQHRVLSLRE